MHCSAVPCAGHGVPVGHHGRLGHSGGTAGGGQLVDVRFQDRHVRRCLLGSRDHVLEIHLERMLSAEAHDVSNVVELVQPR